MAFTRSRPYRKNDNARVEQKNWTHVRQLVGYERLAEPVQAVLLNELYAQEWGQLRNFFCPAMKHLRTEVEGSRKKAHLRHAEDTLRAAQSLRASRSRATRKARSTRSHAQSLRTQAEHRKEAAPGLARVRREPAEGDRKSVV